MRRGALRALAGAAALAALGTPLRAQVLQLDRPRFEFGGDFDGAWFVYPAAPSATLGTFREWLGVTVSGGVPRPGVFGFSGTFAPRWTQQRRTEELVDTARHATGTWLDYRVGATLAAALPVNASGWAQRSSGTEPDVFSGPRDYDVREYGALLDVRSTYTPLRIEFTDRSLRETWLPDGSDLVVRDERVRTARLTGRTRTISLFGERLDLVDRRDGRDFTSYLGNAAHELRWGWGSSFRSAVRYFDRTGFLPQRRLAWTELLHIQHVPAVGSDWRYEQSWVEAGSGRQDVRAAGAMLTVDPSRQVRIAVEGRARWNRFPTGRQDEYVATPHLLLSVDLAPRVQLNAHASAGYEWQRLEPTADGTVDVVNELHVVAASGQFTLQEAFADSTTVVVSSADGTLVYQANLDYRLLPLGELLEVIVLPTGRIQVGDTVLVDYRYRLVPAARADGLVASYGADLRVLSFTAYVRRQTRDPKSTDQVGVFLPSYDDLTTGLSLRQGVGGGFLDLNGEYERRKIYGDAVTLWAARGSFAVPIGLGFRPSISGRVSRSKSGGGVREYNTATGEAALEWSPTPAVRLRARGTTWWWEDTPNLTERFWGAGFDADVRVGGTVLQLLIDRGVWTEGFERQTSRVAARLTRKL